MHDVDEVRRELDKDLMGRTELEDFAADMREYSAIVPRVAVLHSQLLAAAERLGVQLLRPPAPLPEPPALQAASEEEPLVQWPRAEKPATLSGERLRVAQTELIHVRRCAARHKHLRRLLQQAIVVERRCQLLVADAVALEDRVRRINEAHDEVIAALTLIVAQRGASAGADVVECGGVQKLEQVLRRVRSAALLLVPRHIPSVVPTLRGDVLRVAVSLRIPHPDIAGTLSCIEPVVLMMATMLMARATVCDEVWVASALWQIVHDQVLGAKAALAQVSSSP